MKFFRRRDAKRVPQVTIRSGLVVPDLSEPVEMTGTTTVGAEALAALYAAHGRAAGGLLALHGRLIPRAREPC